MVESFLPEHPDLKSEASSGSVVGYDQLSDGARHQFALLLSGLGLKGVVVGALVSGFSRSLLPMVLVDGQTKLLRYFPGSKVTDDSFVKEIHAAGNGKVERFARVAGALVLVRAYGDTMLGKAEMNRALPEIQLKGARGIFDQLLTLHRNNFFHGNVVAENCWVRGDTLTLLDAGARILDERKSDLSPQSRSEIQKRDLLQFLKLLDSAFPTVSDRAPDLGEKAAQFSAEQLLREIGQRIFGLELAPPKEVSHLLSRREKESSGVKSGKFITRRSSEEEVEPAPSFQEPVREVPSVQPSPHPHASIAHEAETPPVIGLGSLPMFAVVLGILGILWIVRGGEFPFSSSGEPPPEKNFNYSAYWGSGQPPFLREVAKAAAVDGTLEAQQVVFDSVVRGDAPSVVAASLIRNALSQPWSVEYDEGDRKFLFAVALKPLLPPRTVPEKPFSEVHPAILLAFLAELPPDENKSWFGAVRIETLEDLFRRYSFDDKAQIVE
ncbi:MAG: hypothetical protein KDD64_04370, partial [Bdellovibrionales bacterium]|nr:hypothetical protein [Bdellovibrionales bacterium]